MVLGVVGGGMALRPSTAAVAQPDLLQSADKQVVDFVVQYCRHLHVFAAVRLCQRLAFCE